MKNIQHIIQDLFITENTPHHFFTIESHSLMAADVSAFLPKSELGYVFAKHYDSFGVDDARGLISLQNERTEKKSVYIISLTVITLEAQNALLKALEEPKPNKIFFFIVSSVKKLIPTLQSRTYVLIDNHINIDMHDFNILDFIQMSLQKRFDYIKKITDKKLKGDDMFSKSDLLHVLNNFEVHFHAKKNITMLRKISAARKYMHAKSSSIKMILDDIAMTISLLDDK